MSDVEDGEQPTYADLIDELTALESAIDDPDLGEQFDDVIETVRQVESSPVFGRVIRGFDVADLAEATVGALLFGIPMFVEGGTNEVGTHLVTAPLSLLFTGALVVGLTIGIVYVAEIQDVRVQYAFFGFIPRRLVGILGATAVTATVMMSAWGRVDWGEPAFAGAQILVAMVPMSIGAALGDILPGS